MAEDGNHSAPSTRRGSDGSAIINSAAQMISQSPSSSVNLGHSGQTGETSRRRPARLQSPSPQDGYGTISHPPNPSAESSTVIKPKKPALGRRATSMHYPHRGQEFSVDDAEDEVDEDLERWRKQDRQAKVATGTARSRSMLRRRQNVNIQPPTLPIVPSAEEEGEEEHEHEHEQGEEEHHEEVEDTTILSAEVQPSSSGEEGTLRPEDEEPVVEEEDDGEVSDADSFTLKDRQDAINVTHPFGIRIWKPALYKKNRSVQKTAEDEIHSTPGGHVSNWLLFFNFLWTILFGWWLALISFVGALFCLFFGLISEPAAAYGVVLLGLSKYLLYPFGKYVKLVLEEAYAEEDEGEGRSISEYEQWQSGDIEEGRLFFGPVSLSRSLIGRRRTSVSSADETQSLLGRTRRGMPARHSVVKRRLFGRGKWNLGRVIFFGFFYGLILPALFLVSGICWLFVFTIPMGKVTALLMDHLRRHPLALSFHSDSRETRYPGEPPSTILVCTYRAIGPKYWKYTIDGTNVFLINLLSIVAFTIFDFYVLYEMLHLDSLLTSPFFIFALAIFSVIPLAYFIGQAVASISAQSSMGVGATVNAFFSTIIEVYLYCIALQDGKAQLVEGSVIGSIFVGILFLPGISMCFGALKRKTQRFNVESAGVTSTMMLFAMIGAFGPTLFYQIYGSHELKCHECTHGGPVPNERDCRRCFFSQIPAVYDRFYQDAVLPYSWLSASSLFLAYVIGLLFTLRTHAAVIWTSDVDEKKAGDQLNSSQVTTSQQLHESPETLTRQLTANSSNVVASRTDVRAEQIYQRILGQSLKQIGLAPLESGLRKPRSDGPASIKSPHIVPPKTRDGEITGLNLQSLSEADNQTLTRHVAEMAAAAAATATREATKPSRKTAQPQSATRQPSERPQQARLYTAAEAIDDALHPPEHAAAGGHDAPNWSRTKSAVILLSATVAYALIAEILVNTVDAVLQSVDVDEKFLGITLFALVPSTTEFLNAISFAMNGNIALSMEIGSAYALQVCLLQIPCLVLFSAVHGRWINPADMINHTFTLIFPQWDMVTVILCIFLLSYMYGEGKSNYFKGSILILSYLAVITGFWFASYDPEGRVRGVSGVDTLAVGSYMDLRSMVGTKKGFAM